MRVSGDRVAAPALQTPLACLSPQAPCPTTDNSSQFSRSTAWPLLCVRSSPGYRPSSIAPGPTCCTTDICSSPPTAWPLLPAYRPLRNSSSQSGIRLPPALPALPSGAAALVAPAGHSDTFAEKSGTLPLRRWHGFCPDPDRPDARSEAL